MTRMLLRLLVVSCMLGVITCPPVKPDPTTTTTESPEDIKFGLEYEHYLKQVVSVLEGDEDFKKKLDEANSSDIKTGSIARHLHFVSHSVRTKLDELKRVEVSRLHKVIRAQQRIKDGISPGRIVAHLDQANPHSFEVDDLQKLIKQATSDLEDVDKKRKDEFKNYEMEKEHLRKKNLSHLNTDEKKVELDKEEMLKKKHKDHPKLHHPGSKDQFEELWQERDGMDKANFNPKTFFHLHDTNGDGMLDETEVEALFQVELDKMYDNDAPEDDMMERYEEMNRMREHVMDEIDRNDDKMVSLAEFIASTKKAAYSKDEGWKGLDEGETYTDEELTEYEKELDDDDDDDDEEHHAQPGEVNIPPKDHMEPVQGGHTGGVNTMEQQAGNQHQQQQQQQQPPAQEHVPVQHHDAAEPAPGHVPQHHDAAAAAHPAEAVPPHPARAVPAHP